MISPVMKIENSEYIPLYFAERRSEVWVLAELMVNKRDANAASRRLNKLTKKLTRLSKGQPRFRMIERKDGQIIVERVKRGNILAFPL